MIHDDTLPDRVVSYLAADSLAIFLIHGVVPRQTHKVRNYTGKHMTADLFAKVMQRLAKEGTALSLDQVLEYSLSGRPLPPRAFALTFDDGFENNLSVAAPILADQGIPGTIYATTGFVEENGMSWIDRIEYAVEDCPARTLRVDWTGQVFQLDGAESRIEFLKAVRRYVKNDPNCDSGRFADELCAELGKPGRISSDDPLDRKLSWDQIRATHRNGLILFGGHTHTHPILSFLAPERLAFELDTSLALMRDKGGVDASHYSYPEGLAHCFNETVIAELKARGVRCCPTAIDGTNHTGTDPFHLRRIMVA
jgi:peptidoglycan/xylan/chitin deacetylase (PgdA/CDA1 family)